MADGALATLAIVALTILGMLIRPWRAPEFVFAGAGALALLAAGLLPLASAFAPEAVWPRRRDPDHDRGAAPQRCRQLIYHQLISVARD